MGSTQSHDNSAVLKDPSTLDSRNLEPEDRLTLIMLDKFRALDKASGADPSSRQRLSRMQGLFLNVIGALRPDTNMSNPYFRDKPTQARQAAVECLKELEELAASFQGSASGRNVMEGIMRVSHVARLSLDPMTPGRTSLLKGLLQEKG